MAEIVNDRDLLIMAAVPRFTPPTDRGMFLTPPAAIFRASGDGSTSTPPSFTFKATLLNMAGVVSFAASNGAKLSVNAAANEATLDYAAYTAAGAEAVYITAAIAVDGANYTQQAIVTKVSDGNPGQPGPRGAGHFYVVGSSWSDTVAEMATPGSSMVDDVVTISNGSTFTGEKRWNGSAWVATAVVIPGSLLVENSITASKIDTRGLSIRDAAGNVILAAGSALPAAYAASGTVNADLVPVIDSTADAARVAAINAAAVDAQAKADAAGNMATSAAATYAAAQANLARTNAQAYADGKVTAEEQRAINDATNKAEAARVAAVNAAATDATAKAAVAATMSTWAGTVGPGKPADNATVGADSNNLNVGISRNLLANSAPGTLAGYTFGISAAMNIESNAVILAQGSHPYKQYSPNNTCVYVHAIGTPPDGSVIDIYPNAGSMAPVIPKKRYEAGVSLSSHRCVGQVRIKWFDLNRVYIRENIGNPLANNEANYLTLPFPRSTVFGIAPDNAAFAVVSATGLNNGGSDVHIFASQFYFGEATMAQTVPSNWIEGGASDTRALGFFGDLDATKGAEIGKNLAGQFTAANISTFIQAAAIGLALIDKASITNLAALSAFLGTVDIADGGALRMKATAYNSDPGIWIGLINGVPKMSMVAPNGSKILFDPSAAQQIQLVNVGVAQSPLNVTITTTGGNLTTSYGRNASLASTVAGYVNVADGTGNYQFDWVATADGYPCWPTNPTGSNCSGAMKGPGIAVPDGVGFVLSCNVKDLTTGRTGRATFQPTILFQ